jgi:hypothetical protein
MASTQQFAGDFSSQLHQLNGNQFYGPVSISAPETKDRGHLTAVQGGSRGRFAEQSGDTLDEGYYFNSTKGLSWDG